MTQHIDIRYTDEVRSAPINKRFLDIAKPNVLTGFRLTKGSTDFGVSLIRNFHKVSSAITPSGARVEETSDLVDILTIRPNNKNYIRHDSIYMKYEFGRLENEATYVVIEGAETPATNPNPATHLLLGYVYVPVNNQILSKSSFKSVPEGVRIPKMVGDTVFEGNMTVKGDLAIEGDLHALIGGDIQATFIEKLPFPIIAEKNQWDFKLPKPYMVGNNSLFVYVNEELLMPEDFVEVDNLHFRLAEPCKGGERIWAFWFLKLQLVKMEPHDHDDLYYRKHEIDRRMVIYAKGNFKGMVGESIQHNLEGVDYTVIGVTPTVKSENVGSISTDKKENHIIVYNTGSERGSFDIAYILENDEDVFPETVGNVHKTIVSEYDKEARNYAKVQRYRRDGSLHSTTLLSAKNARGDFTRLDLVLYSYSGADIVYKRTWHLLYNIDGIITSSERVI